jgi:hypothetical protein
MTSPFLSGDLPRVRTVHLVLRLFSPWRPRRRPRQGQSSKDRTCDERRTWAERTPKPARYNACQQQGYAARQIENAERRSAQIFRATICNQGRQKPFGGAHVQAPQHRTKIYSHNILSSCQHEVCSDQEYDTERKQPRPSDSVR